jgi:hypothetical protein
VEEGVTTMAKWPKRERERYILQARTLKPLIVTTDGRQRVLPAPTWGSSADLHRIGQRQPRFEAAHQRNMAALRWVVDRNEP